MAGKLATLALAMPALVMGRRFQMGDDKIVGGEAAKAGEFPYIVSLQEGGSHFCGGSLLSADTVITAAHCSVNQDAADVKVRAGTLTWQKGGQVVGVKSITVHPDFQDASEGNDVAIWKLSSSILAGNSSANATVPIGFATLPKNGTDPKEGETAIVAGWGDLTEGAGEGSPTLQKVDVPIVGRAACGQDYDGQYNITSTMICAAKPEGGVDSCQGDSGGPIVDKTGTLIGLVSFGTGCAEKGYPGVYSRVSALLDFINKNA